MKPLLIVIVGPTGVGKSIVAVELALKLNGEIISADSMQVYRGLDIGTAKITKGETKGVPHHLLDIVDPDEPFSVADFQKLARNKIHKISSRGKLPLLVGGTGLYVKAVIDPYQFQVQEVNMSRREELHQLAKSQGNQYVHRLLTKVDPELAAKFHPNDIRRVIRGIEYYEATGNKISDNYFNCEQTNKEPEFRLVLIGLSMERRQLYQRLEDRIDLMINAGLLNEVKELLNNGYNPNLVSMQGLGYKEISGYLQGEYSFADAIRVLKRNTRHFAKRQLTWFRKDNRIKWFLLDEANISEIVPLIFSYIGR